MIKIISGAQTGADVAGLWAAKLHGLPTGGLAPKGFITLNGPHPEMAETFGIKEHPKTGYRDRTIENVLSSNVTLVCSEHMSSPGTVLTLNTAKRNEVTHYALKFDPADLAYSLNNFDANWVTSMIVGLVARHEKLFIETPFVINVAGNATQNSARVFEFTFKFCSKLFKELGYSAPDADWKFYKDTWK
jgi:hypothetical protein